MHKALMYVGVDVGVEALMCFSYSYLHKTLILRNVLYKSNLYIFIYHFPLFVKKIIKFLKFLLYFPNITYFFNGFSPPTIK